MRISDCSSDVCSSDLKAKEVAAALLLSKEEFGSPIRIDPHASVAYFAEAAKKPKGRLTVDRELQRLAAALGHLPGHFAAILRTVRPAAEEREERTYGKTCYSRLRFQWSVRL